MTRATIIKIKRNNYYCVSKVVMAGLILEMLAVANVTIVCGKRKHLTTFTLQLLAHSWSLVYIRSDLQYVQHANTVFTSICMQQYHSVLYMFQNGLYNVLGVMVAIVSIIICVEFNFQLLSREFNPNPLQSYRQSLLVYIAVVCNYLVLPSVRVCSICTSCKNNVNHLSCALIT